MPNPASVAAAATISTGAVVCAAVAFEVFVFRPWRRENWPDGVKAGLQREWDGLRNDLKNGLWEMRNEFDEQRHRSQQPVPGSADYAGLSGGQSSVTLFDHDQDGGPVQHNDPFRAEMEAIEMQQRQHLDRVRADMAETTAASSGAEQRLRTRQPYRDQDTEVDTNSAPKTDILVDVSAPAPAPDNTSSQELQFPVTNDSGAMPLHASGLDSLHDLDRAQSPTLTEQSWQAARSEAASTAHTDGFSLVHAPSESGQSRASHDDSISLVDARSPGTMSAVRSQTDDDEDWLALDDAMTSSSNHSRHGSPRTGATDPLAAAQHFSSSVGTIMPH